MTTRQESRDNYLKAVENKDIFFKGLPCRRGGHTLRYRIGRNCVECKKIDDKSPKRKDWHKSPRVLEMKKKISKEWYHIPENKKKKMERQAQGYAKRYKNDPTFRCFALLRSSLSNFLKQVGTIKEDRTHEIVGYTPREFYDSLKSKLKKGMTMENQGKDGWEIDHIRPLSWFTKGQEKECFALSNLKPEWAEWNVWKSNNFEGSSEEYPMPRETD